MLEEILDIRNIRRARKQVTANKGAGGVGGMQTDELRDYLNANWQKLRSKILEGSYLNSGIMEGGVSTPRTDYYYWKTEHQLKLF